MSTYQFKTNINCGNCVAKVTPMLNEEANIEKWEVDTTNPDKILTARGESLQPEQVIKAIGKVGFKAELV
jgi:copper chaperone